MDEHWNFNKEKNIRKYQTQFTELKNTVIAVKNTLKGIKRRLDDTQKWICDPEIRVVEITQTPTEQQKDKQKV